MKKQIILVVVLFIILIAVCIGAVIVIQKLDNKDQNNISLNEQSIEYIINNNTQNIIEEKYVEVQDNGIKQNKSVKLNEVKVFNGLEISNVDYFLSNGQTIFRAEITNKSGNDFTIKAVDIVLLDDNNNEIGTIPAVINNVKNGEKVKIDAAITLDFANAYDYKIIYK